MIVIAMSIVQGEPFLGFPTVASKVLYVVLERYRDFWRRYKEIIDKQNVPNLKILECKKPLILDSNDDKDFTFLKDTIKSWKPDLVIIDSKYRTTSKKEVDEEATKLWTIKIEKLIEDEKCSILVIHHSPKMEYEELVNRAAGSSLMARWADVIIGVKRVNKKTGKTH